MENSIAVLTAKRLGLLNGLAVTANNIANANTNASKRDNLIFKELLISTNNKNKEISFSNDIKTFRNNTNGLIKQTARPYDVALMGEGYFVVRTPQGERYTRAGNFQLNNLGVLVDQNYYPVLGKSGNELNFNAIEQLTINDKAEIIADDQIVDSFAVVNFANPEMLQKISGNLYVTADQPIDARDFTLIQGAIEQSNIEPVIETVTLIEQQRGIEINTELMNSLSDLTLKTIKTFTETTK